MATAKRIKGRKTVSGLCANCEAERQQRRSRALLFEYATAVFPTWIGLMTSDASMALTCWAAYFPAIVTRIGPLVLGTLAIGCFVLASYRLWANERNQSIKLLCQEGRKQSRPSAKVT